MGSTTAAGKPEFTHLIIFNSIIVLHWNWFLVFVCISGVCDIVRVRSGTGELAMAIYFVEGNRRMLLDLFL